MHPKVLTKEEIYQKLAFFYKYTPEQIASMNPFQQLALLNVKEEEATLAHFETMEEYLHWKAELNV